MDDLMKLVIGWTIVGGFLFTTVITCLSLVGWVRFADPRQQKRLFSVLIVEVVVGAGVQVMGFATFDTATVRTDLTTAGANDANMATLAEALDLAAEQRAAPDKEQLTRIVARIKVKPTSSQAEQVAALRKAVDELPAGKIDIKRAKDLRIRIPPPTR